MREYYVYMLASRSRRLYVGMTNDLERRVSEHKFKAVDSFTSRYHIDRLVWFESTNGALEAIEREHQIKRWRRGKKIHLIEMENEAWEDLAADW
jgi:putative endonuclease